MSTSSATSSSTDGTALRASLPPATRTPSLLRRVALVAAGLPALALPVIWGGGAAGMLLTGYESDHRFHQLTGQGVLTGALWLAGLLPLLVAGWRGRRPSTAAGLHHLAFMAASALCAAFVPGDGVVVLGGIVVVTGALVWAALPLRPRLRGALGALDPALAPIAALSAALYLPFVLEQRTLQAAMGDEHATMTHYFDMAWVSAVLVALAVVATFAPAARRLALVSSLGTLVVGLGRLAFTSEVPWSTAAIALGLAGSVVAVLRLRAS